MHQNVRAFHAANGMLNKDTDLTQGFIGSFLIIAQLRVGVLFALARLLCRDVNPLTPGVRLNTKIASINPNIDICKPGQLRRKRLVQHHGIVVVAAQRPPQKDDQLVRERHDRILQRILFLVVLENNNEHLKQPSERHLTFPLLPLPEGTAPVCYCREALGVPGSADG